MALLFIRRGNEARDARDWQRAAICYEEALQLTPQRADIHVQLGHMLKEAGAYEAAEIAYGAARALIPDDADLALQIGHLLKIVGRSQEARQSYARALMLKPRWAEAEREIAELDREEDPAPPIAPDQAEMIPTPLLAEALEKAATDLSRADLVDKLVPTLAPRSPASVIASVSEGVDLRDAGRHEPGFWGLRRTLRGVEAVRGYCVSPTPIDEIQLLVDGQVFYRGAVTGPYPVGDRPQDPLAKYVFNIWLDFSAIELGQHAFEVRAIDTEGETKSVFDQIVIAPPLSITDFPASDALIAAREPDARALEEQIRHAPSMLRPARREIFVRPPQSILVMRTDQLGDLVASIAALRRLRALFPGARLVGLLTGANADLAATLDLFDEIIVIDFPDDPIEQRRVMPLDQQEDLRRRLATYRFDVAIDLAQSSVSRELLRLSGARFLYGDEEGGFDWLAASFSIHSRDPLNRLDFVPHSRKTLALVESLGAIAQDSFEVVRRPDLSRERLGRFGVDPSHRYALLHMGARIAFSRWPGFIALAQQILRETGLDVVMMSDDKATQASLPPGLAASSRFRLIDERLPFDDFDAFISFADIVVGNDSGPKHLASLRGVNVVTVHTARINWNDWGQEQIGTIISRRVPCAGCNIFHNTEECGKGFACIRDIRPTEVFEAVKAYL